MKDKDQKSNYRIAIDARLVTDKVVGISRYSLNLIIGILDKPDLQIFCIVNTDHLSAELKKRGCHNRVSFIRAKSRPLSVLEHFEIPWLLTRYSIDLFHATSYMTPVWVPCKFVYSILDTFHLIFPEGFSWIANWYFKFVVRNAARKAKCILTISNASKKDIEKYITKKKQIHVIYLGYNNISKYEKPFDEMSNKYGIEKSGYFLFLGNHRVHKNYQRVIIAYQLLKKKDGKAPQLVLNLSENILKEFVANDSDTFQGVNCIGFINDEDIYTIYKNALCLVVPSLYEGFGLFILEAMDVGIPIITSNISSLPEVAGDAVLYVNPYDENEIASAMKQIAEDEELRLTLISKGREQIKKFSWDKCVDNTYQIYKNTLVEKRVNER